MSNLRILDAIARGSVRYITHLVKRCDQLTETRGNSEFGDRYSCLLVDGFDLFETRAIASGKREAGQPFVSGAAATRVKTIVTRVPCPGVDTTSSPALAFSRND